MGQKTVGSFIFSGCKLMKELHLVDLSCYVTTWHPSQDRARAPSLKTDCSLSAKQEPFWHKSNYKIVVDGKRASVNSEISVL